jgi:hypothetical protein
MSTSPGHAIAVKWLHEALQPIPHNITATYRLGRQWKKVAGFISSGSIFLIYKDANAYCAHAGYYDYSVGDFWPEGEEPCYGYYDVNLSWRELISQLAQTYDNMYEAHRH